MKKIIMIAATLLPMVGHGADVSITVAWDYTDGVAEGFNAYHKTATAPDWVLVGAVAEPGRDITVVVPEGDNCFAVTAYKGTAESAKSQACGNIAIELQQVGNIIMSIPSATP